MGILRRARRSGNASEAGKYLGLSNLATAGAGAASRFGGPIIDGLNVLLPGSAMGYPATFVLAAIATLGGTLVLLKLWRKQTNT